MKEKSKGIKDPFRRNKEMREIKVKRDKWVPASVVLAAYGYCKNPFKSDLKTSEYNGYTYDKNNKHFDKKGNVLDDVQVTVYVSKEQGGSRLVSTHDLGLELNHDIMDILGTNLA